MAGRPRKSAVISKQRMGKAEKTRRQMEEEKLKVGREGLVPPEWLSDEAMGEFVRVVEEAGNIGLFDNLDLVILAIYCNAFDQYSKISKETQRINDVKMFDPSLISIQENYAKQILQCSAKLGLSTTDRLKLIVPMPEDVKGNKYLKYSK